MPRPTRFSPEVRATPDVPSRFEASPRRRADGIAAASSIHFHDRPTQGADAQVGNLTVCREGWDEFDPGRAQELSSSHRSDRRRPAREVLMKYPGVSVRIPQVGNSAGKAANPIDRLIQTFIFSPLGGIAHGV